MNGIHEDDYSAIGTQHEQVTGRINDMLIELQNHAYATGVERGKELAKQAAIEAGTISPTLCQTIHLGQPGVTFQTGHMLDPAGEEVATLTIAAEGTELRLSFPTESQASMVLQALVGQAETVSPPPPICQLVPFNPTKEQWGGLARDLMMWLDMSDKTVESLKKHLDMLDIEVPDWLKEETEFNGRGVPSKGSRVTWIYKAMLSDLPGYINAQDTEWHDGREEQSPELAAAIQAREEAISQVHGLKTQLGDLVAAAQPIINALAGPGHHIREMQATVKIDENNPIIVLAKLCAAYRKQEAHT